MSSRESSGHELSDHHRARLCISACSLGFPAAVDAYSPGKMPTLILEATPAYASPPFYSPVGDRRITGN
jgi:hypothetical protein